MIIMNHERIVCISGKAGSGKDTFGQMLKEELENRGKKVLIVHNADLVKYICTYFLNWNGKKDEQGRTLLQTFGTDVVRDNYNEDFWVSSLDVFISLSRNIIKYDYIIIPDCRFYNEVNYWLTHNYHVDYFPIIRENYASNLTDKQKNHASEVSLDERFFVAFSPFTVYNNQGLNELRKIALNATKEILRNEILNECNRKFDAEWEGKIN